MAEDMILHDEFEKLGLNKSLKLAYDDHDVKIYKYDTYNRISLAINNIEVLASKRRRYKGFLLVDSYEDQSMYIQMDGNIAERQIFSYMCQFVLDKVRAIKNLNVNDIEEAITDWIDFSKKQSESLAEPLQIGFFGELLFFRSLLGLIGEDSALKSWHGPERKKVDFVLSKSFAVEIKSVSDPLSNTITISSIEQLSAGYENHFVRVYKLVEAGVGGITIKQLFSEIFSSLTSQNQDSFVKKCYEYGYNYMNDYEGLLNLSYSNHVDFAAHKADFPKVVGPLDPRVIDVKYKITLDNLTPLDEFYLIESFPNPKIE